MARFIIDGGHPLKGDYRPAGNKNAALPMLAACLLTDQEVCLSNIPDIEDVRVMLQLIRQVGADVTLRGHTVRIRAHNLRTNRLDPDLCKRVRSSILLAGPLVARLGNVELPPPGGDVIGRRRLDTHFLAFETLGIRIRTTASAFRFLRKKSFRGADILLDEASVTATENILMAAALAPGRTTLFNAACEPHVVDLGRLLARMGARIEGLGTNRITIQGVSRLHGANHRVACDYIEVGSILAAAVATGGRVRIPLRGDTSWLPTLRLGFQRLGVQLVSQHGHLTTHCCTSPPRQTCETADVPKIEDGPWPAFPSDLMSVSIVLATCLPGTFLFFEKMFESRMYFVDHLISMGARIVPCDPHRVVVSGPVRLHASHLSSPDIRAGMALLIAALSASGRSIIENARMIDRGYERIEERLRAIGAHIQRIET